jgi:hypothetical protein
LTDKYSLSQNGRKEFLEIEMSRDQVPQNVSKRIGRNISYLRGKANKTQATVCLDLGYTVNYWSLLENGSRCVGIGGLVRIAEYFGEKPGRIIDEDFWNPNL